MYLAALYSSQPEVFLVKNYIHDNWLRQNNATKTLSPYAEFDVYIALHF